MDIIADINVLIAAYAQDFFRQLLTSGRKRWGCPPPQGRFFLDFIPGENAQLLAPIQLEEVKQAVFDLDPDSASGVDGYTGSFFRHCWSIIATDLLRAVQEEGVPLPFI